MDHQQAMQAMVDGLNALDQKSRSTSQLTLGGLITALKALPPETLVESLGPPFSYRGYYCDLAFPRGVEKMKAAELLSLCQAAMGEVFEGYKGGDFVMGALTPLWIAEYGCCGAKILRLNAEGRFEEGDDE